MKQHWHIYGHCLTSSYDSWGWLPIRVHWNTLTDPECCSHEEQLGKLHIVFYLLWCWRIELVLHGAPRRLHCQGCGKFMRYWQRNRQSWETAGKQYWSETSPDVRIWCTVECYNNHPEKHILGGPLKYVTSSR